MEKPNLNYTRSKVIIISLVFLVAGLILLFTYALYQQRLEVWATNILQELASVLIISGAISAISEFFTRNDYLTEIYGIEKRLRASFFTSENLSRLGNFGIVDCCPDAGRYNYSKFIKDSDTLIVCVNDGRSWLSSNIHPLREHMMKPNSKTIFIMLNPNGRYIPILADKIGLKVNYQTEKIKDTCNQLIDVYKRLPRPTNASISIYWIDLPIVNTIYFSDSLAIIGSFNTSRPRGPMTLLLIANLEDKDTYYHFVKEDLQRLIKDPQTICVFSAKNGKIKSISKDIGEQNKFLQEKTI